MLPPATGTRRTGRVGERPVQFGDPAVARKAAECMYAVVVGEPAKFDALLEAPQRVGMSDAECTALALVKAVKPPETSAQ